MSTWTFSGIKDLLGLNSYQNVKDQLGTLVHQVTDLASFVQVLGKHQISNLVMTDNECTKTEGYFEAFALLAILTSLLDNNIAAMLLTHQVAADLAGF